MPTLKNRLLLYVLAAIAVFGLWASALVSRGGCPPKRRSRVGGLSARCELRMASPAAELTTKRERRPREHARVVRGFRCTAPGFGFARDRQRRIDTACREA
jgi:hypothetical protein